MVSERTVTFRAPPAAQRPMIPAYPHPPTSAPGGNSRDHGRPHLASHSGAAAATRPGTAPVTSPSKDGLAPLYMRATPTPVDVTGRRGASGAPAVQGGSPNSKSVSPAARWNTWAENGSMEPGALQHPMIRELSQDNKSFEQSPAAKKKEGACTHAPADACLSPANPDAGACIHGRRVGRCFCARRGISWGGSQSTRTSTDENRVTAWVVRSRLLAEPPGDQCICAFSIVVMLKATASALLL